MEKMTLNTNTVPVPQTSGPRTYEIPINVTPKAFEGLRRQGMSFHQAVCEIVDDAIAASMAEPALVCIALAADEDKNYLNMAIADWGCGMDLNELANALQLGSLPTGTNRLNEHGFGLNNALACLADDKDTWSIYTRKDKGAFLKVSGPFDTRMKVETTDTLDLPEELHICWEEPSTVVYLRVPMDVVRTVQRRGRRRLLDLAVIRTWLTEHLGVTYRGYLEQNPATMDPYAKIAMTIGKSVRFVAPIEVPVMMAYEKTLEVELGGEIVKASYRYGTLNKAKCETLVQGTRAGYYYQGNQPTQGIDIRLGKRVIATAMLSEIWMKENGAALQRHNHYNDFVGELCIPELPRGVLSTLNNKTGIDRTDPSWETIFEALQQYQPPMNIVSYNEAELKHKWAERQRSADDDNDVSTEVSVWPTGTRIDVVVSNHAGKFDIYELKARKADPQDLYQLRMYWDGLVLSGVQPTRGTLVAPSYSDNLQKMLQMVNELPPPNFPDGRPSSKYCFTFSTLVEKGLV